MSKIMTALGDGVLTHLLEPEIRLHNSIGAVLLKFPRGSPPADLKKIRSVPETAAVHQAPISPPGTCCYIALAVIAQISPELPVV